MINDLKKFWDVGKILAWPAFAVAFVILVIITIVASIAALPEPSPYWTVEGVKAKVALELKLYQQARDEAIHDDPIGHVYPAARKALVMIRKHESLDGELMIGDDGEARGWLGQHQPHWERGARFLGVTWLWPEDTGDLDKCEHIALANWILDCPGYLEQGYVTGLIRHFRLPNAPMRADNTEYLRKVLGTVPVESLATTKGAAE